MQIQCLDDCPPSVLTSITVFAVVATLGFTLARWRRWTPFVWISLSFVVAGPILSSGFGIAQRDWLVLVAAWNMTAFGSFRSKTRRFGAGEFWGIDEGVTDPARFFAMLPDTFPEATHIFIEGGSIASDVAACYARFADPGPYLAETQTIWPRSKKFRCVATRGFFEELANLAKDHAAPELLDHLSLYEGERVLLFWHDAFANAILLNHELPEATVASLASPFGCSYGRTRVT